MPINNLNEGDLDQFTGSEQWYRHSLVRSITYTDGAKYVADDGGAYWLLDEIALGQKFSAAVRAEPFQVWTVGQTKRPCSKEYKTEVIGRILRREILGLRPKTAPKKGVMVRQFIGISLDEAGRAYRMERNVPAPKYIKRHFHLIDT